MGRLLVPWEAVVKLVKWTYVPVLLYGVYTLSALPRSGFAHEEQSFRIVDDRWAPSPAVEFTNELARRETLSAKLDLVERFAPRVELYTQPGDQFLLQAVPERADGRDAMLLVFDYANSTSAMHMFMDATLQICTEAPWLAKTVYALFVSTDRYNQKLKAFADWYLYGTGSVDFRRRKDGARLRRQGIIRQALGYKPTSRYNEAALHLGRTGPRSPNVDFAATLFQTQVRMSSALGMDTVYEQIIGELECRSCHQPHSYLNDKLIDALTFELPILESPATSYPVIAKTMRAINEMVLKFHHLSSQYWFHTDESKTTSMGEMLIGIVCVMAPLICSAYIGVLSHTETIWIADTWQPHQLLAHLPGSLRLLLPDVAEYPGVFWGSPINGYLASMSVGSFVAAASHCAIVALRASMTCAEIDSQGLRYVSSHLVFSLAATFAVYASVCTVYAATANLINGKHSLGLVDVLVTCHLMNRSLTLAIAMLLCYIIGCNPAAGILLITTAPILLISPPLVNLAAAILMLRFPYSSVLLFVPPFLTNLYRGIPSWIEMLKNVLAPEACGLTRHGVYNELVAVVCLIPIVLATRSLIFLMASYKYLRRGRHLKTD